MRQPSYRPKGTNTSHNCLAPSSLPLEGIPNITLPLRLSFKCSVNIFRCERILGFKILMKYSYFPPRIIFAFKIQQQIQQQSTVFPATERDIYIVKCLEDIFKRFCRARKL